MNIILPVKNGKLIDIDRNNPKYVPYRVNQLIGAAILTDMSINFTIEGDGMAPTGISLVNGEYRHIGDMSPTRRKKILNAVVTHGKYGESKNEYASHYVITAKIDEPEY